MFERGRRLAQASDSAGGTEGGKSGGKMGLLVVGAVVAAAIGYQLLTSEKKTETDSPAAGEGSPVELAMWDQEESTNTPYLDKWIGEFEQENPNIKVTRQTFQTEDLRNRFTTFATGGQAAEVLYGPNDFAGVFATAKIIAPIDDFVEADRFTQASLDAVKLNGKYMGVPLSYGNHLMLFYNKKVIAEAPQTTDELIALARQYSDPSKNQYGLVFFQNEPFWLAPFIGGFGGWPLKYTDGAATIDLDSPGVAGALAFLRRLKFDEKVIPTECDYDCAKGLFVEGKAPLTINGDWVVAEFTEALGKENLGIAPLPIVSETGQPMNPMVSGRYLFINGSLSDEKQKAVSLFVRFMTSKRVQIEVGELMNRIPANREALESAEVQALPDLKPIIDAAANGRAMPAEPEMRAAWDAMRPALQKVMSGDLEPDAAARLMQQSALEKLAALKE
jgi:arabinogalactan oligomer/maltooligosaccharide transport system substrate-binding protein